MRADFLSRFLALIVPNGDLKMQPVEELELTGEEERWISVKALREVEQPETPTQKLPIQPEGTAEVNVPRELDKLLPAEVREIDRNPDAAPVPVRVFVSYAHDDERQLKRLDAMLDVLEQYQQHLDNLRRKDSLRGAATTEISVRLRNYSASHFEGSACREKHV
jgi:hypothetical protein